MKKGTILWILIAASLVIVGAILFVGAMMKVNWDFRKLSTVEYETNRYVLSESIHDISIESITADIEFLPSDSSEASVVCYEEKNVKHSVTVKDGTLTIQAQDNRKWYDHVGIHWGTSKITVYLPAGEYGSLSLEVTTGDMKLPADFSFEQMNIDATTGDIKTSASVSGSASIETTTGDIQVSNLSAGAINLSVTTGDITLSSVTCRGEMKVDVSTGDTKLSDVSCESLYSNGTTGDLILNNVIATKRFDLERTTGDIKLESCDAEELVMETATGNVKGSLLTEKIFITETGTGSVSVPKSTSGGRCEISTATGSIHITVNS